MKTLLVMAGGTGGHIFPGLAVAELMRTRGWRVVWMGNANGMEARIVPEHGFETTWIRFSALRGKGVMRKLLLPMNLLRGFWQAVRALRRIRPDVVLGLGGYVTFPGGMMAVLLGRPLVLHEQNSVAGLANKVLARVADNVLTGFPDVLRQGRWVGNPVRDSITCLEAPEQRYGQRRGVINLLVVGGSLGAAVLNEIVPEALARLPEGMRPRVVHQSGRQHLDVLRAAYERAGVEGELVPFIENMDECYARADVVLCRAGALTVSELAAAGVASILVPLPHAVDDHQSANARFLAEREAALLLPQSQLTAERLAQMLQTLDRGALQRMAELARSLARPRAASDVADTCERLAAGDKA